MERTPILKGSIQGVSLKEIIFLHHICGNLVISNYLGSLDRARTQDFLELQHSERAMVHRSGAIIVPPLKDLM